MSERPDELDDLLPAAFAVPGGREPLPQARARVRAALAPRRPWVRTAAAALLLAAGGLWHLHSGNDSPATSPAPKPGPARDLVLGRIDRDEAWQSGRGVSVLLSAGGRARTGTEGREVSIDLESGTLWCEAAASVRIRTPHGILQASGSTLWMRLGGSPALPPAAGLLREARASVPAPLRVGVLSGAAVWEHKAGSLRLKAGDALHSDGSGSRLSPWDAGDRDGAEAWASRVREGGWTDLLAPGSRGRLRASADLADAGVFRLTGASETDWIESDFPAVGEPYVMELSARVTGRGARAALAYPADGRLPLLDLEEGAWRSLRVVHALEGTEIWSDGACLRRFAPGALAAAPLRSHPLRKPGLLLWHGGAVEVRSWRVKRLDARGLELP